MERFFVAHPNPMMRLRALAVLRFLRVSDRPLGGKAEGWTAGIVYLAANLDRRACGVPGILNSEFEELMGVSMDTARRRAAQMERVMTV